MKILIRGYYGFGNLGDDLLLSIAYTLVKNKFANSEVFVFSNNTQNNPDSCHHPDFHQYIHILTDTNVKIIDWNYREHFDIIFHGGGGTYFDNIASGHVYSLLNQVLRLMPASFTVTSERVIRFLINRPVNQQTERRIGLGIGIGPYHFSSKQLARATVELASFTKLLVRDSISLNVLRNITTAPIIDLSTDISFLNDQWISQALRKTSSTLGIIGIILKGKSNSYYTHYLELINDLKRKGFSPEVFAFDEQFDQDMIEIFTGQCPINVWRPNNDRLEAFFKRIKRCELCLSDRAHGTLIATQLNVPNLIIKSSLKSMQVAEMAGISDTISGVEIKRDYTVKDVESLRRNSAVVKKSQVELVKRRKELIKRQASSIFAE